VTSRIKYPTSTWLFVLGLGFHAACGGSGAQRTSVDDDSVPPAVRPDPATESQVITLTGCLQRDVAPVEFTLASVATAGIIDPAPVRQEGAAESRLDPGARASVVADSSYRLLAEDDADLVSHVGHRVTVAGRLAAETPHNPPPSQPRGAEVGRDTTSSTVVADAPELRGFHVTSIRKVSDTCSAAEKKEE
jgi:hypothetical protein